MDWSVLFPLLFWNMNGVDTAGNLCEEGSFLMAYWIHDL